MFGITFGSGKLEEVSVSESTYNVCRDAWRRRGGGWVDGTVIREQIRSVEYGLGASLYRDKINGTSIHEEESQKRLRNFLWELQHVLEWLEAGKWFVVTYDGNRLEYRPKK